MDRLMDIEARIADLEKIREAEDKRDHRLLDEAKGLYEAQEKTEVPGLAPFLKKLNLEYAEIGEFYQTQAQEAKRRVETASAQLKLTKQELELVEREVRAIPLINPCSMVNSISICQFHAASCSSSHWATSNASGSCVCNTLNNECNPKVEAFGQGVNGWRSAQVHSWCYFNIGARPNPAMVHIDTLLAVHGFYILQTGFGGSSLLRLDLEAKGFQYGYSWGSATSTVLNLSGNTMGRHDGTRHLHFEMPVGGGDPFVVRVSAKLTAQAKKGGSSAIGDFATGVGNFIKTFYVNTYSY